MWKKTGFEAVHNLKCHLSYSWFSSLWAGRLVVALGLLFSGGVSGRVASSPRTLALGSWLTGKDSVGRAHTTVHMWRSVGNFVELVFSFCLGNGTQLLAPEPSGRPKARFHLGQQGQSRQSGQDACFAWPQRGFLLFALPLPWRLTVLF